MGIYIYILPLFPCRMHYAVTCIVKHKNIAPEAVALSPNINGLLLEFPYQNL